MKPKTAFAVFCLGLCIAGCTHKSAAQGLEDFGCPQVPASEGERISLLHDLSDLGDVPKSDPAIIHDELIMAKNNMRCFQRKPKANIDKFQQDKSDFRTKIEAALRTASVCDAKSSAQVKDALSGLLPAQDLPDWAQPNSATTNAVRSLVSSPDLCKTFRAAAANLVKTHDDEVDEKLKLANDQYASAQEIARAYQVRYQTLKDLSTAWSENTFQRLVAVFVILTVVIFAGGIFWIAGRVFGSDLTKELVESGQLIQFPTVMILLVVVTVLGLSHIIEDKTLGTLLGAIAGYVLAQGVGKAASREAIKDVIAGQRIGAAAVTPPASPPDKRPS